MARLKPLWLHLGRLSERLQRSTELRVACDYDGTLTPIVEHPDQAALAPRAREALARLARLPDTRLAIVSGRSLQDLANHVGIPGVFLAGVVGLEVQDEAGRRSTGVAPEDALPAAVRAELDAWCARFPGTWLEDKQFSLALHYRGLDAALQPAFGAGVRRRVRPHAERVELVHGKKVFEVLPAVGRDKSAALEQWLADRRHDSVVFFFGDDTHDEPAHRRIRREDGVAVAVGRLASRAEYMVPTPEDVIWFIEWLTREWEAIHAARETHTAAAGTGA